MRWWNGRPATLPAIMGGVLVVGLSFSCACTTQNPRHAARGSGYFDNLPLSVKELRDDDSVPHERWSMTAGLAAASVATRWQLDGPDAARWRGGVLFDDRVRDALRGDTATRRDRASSLSDALRGGLWAWLLTDTALVRGRREQTQWYRPPNRESKTTTVAVVPEINPHAVVIHCAVRW